LYAELKTFLLGYGVFSTLDLRIESAVSNVKQTGAGDGTSFSLK
jgi:hypothetical protein